MLELHPTPLLGATLLLLLSIGTWWLIVEWVFSAPPEKRSKSEHQLESSTTANSPPDTSKPNNGYHYSQTVETAHSHRTGQIPDTKTQDAQEKTGFNKSDITASVTSTEDIKAVAASSDTGSGNRQTNSQRTMSGAQSRSTSKSSHKTHQRSAEQRSVNSVKQLAAISANAQANNQATKQAPVKAEKSPATTQPKYQTAAKAKRPAEGSEASLQIPVTTATSSAYSTTRNVHSISVAANSAKNQRSKAKLKKETCAPIAVELHQENISGSKQTPIEKIMEQQSLTRTSLAEQDCGQSEAPKTVDDDATLRAQLAASEQRIKTLQSTLSNLQNTLPVMATPLTAIPQPHTRPSLSSKVRVLDSSRV